MRGKRIGYSGEEEKIGNWLITFNDLMTLLLVFFVLIFSMSSIDIEGLKDIQSSIRRALGVLKEGEKMSIGVVEPHTLFSIITEEEMLKVMSPVVLDHIEGLDSEPGIRVTFNKERVLITIEDTVIFPSGIGDINAKAFPALDKITTIINKMSYPVRIEGHTDNDPIRTERFPSNWELSTARAVNVLKYFIELGNVSPNRLSAVGYGEAKPLFPNDTTEHKSKNRRVEIVLVMEEKT